MFNRKMFRTKSFWLYMSGIATGMLLSSVLSLVKLLLPFLIVALVATLLYVLFTSPKVQANPTVSKVIARLNSKKTLVE